MAATLAGQALGVAAERVPIQPPSVTLKDAKGDVIRFDRLLAEDRPTVIEFFFTSCPTICPVMASTLASTRTEFAALDRDYRVIWISMDPEQDAPGRLMEYAEHFDMDNHWLLLTGARRDVERLLDAFDARPASNNKMNHQPYAFFRGRSGGPWLRSEGLLNKGELIATFAEALGKKPAERTP